MEVSRFSEAQAVSLAGEQLWLRSDRTVWLPPEAGLRADCNAPMDGRAPSRWPAGGTLLVADVHLGKAQQFSALGLPLSAAARQGPDGDTLTRLVMALRQTASRRLVVLGDLFHGPQSGDSIGRLAEALAIWVGEAGQGGAAELVLIGGNHDTRARADLSPLAKVLGAGLVCLPETGHWRWGELACTHHPEPVEGAAYTLCGHWHPCVTLRAPGRDRVRLPCFWLGSAARHPLGILPAFGSFTGMHPIARRGAADAVWAVTPEGLHRVPA